MDVAWSTFMQTLGVGPGFESLQSNVVVNVLLMIEFRILFVPWTLILRSGSCLGSAAQEERLASSHNRLQGSTYIKLALPETISTVDI